MKRATALKQAPPRATLGPPVSITLSEIVGIDPCNARRLAPSPDAIAELADAIRQSGLINPLILRGSSGAYRVLAGGRRWRALKLIARPSDDVRVRVFAGGDDEAAELSIEENIERADLHPLDEADGVAELAMASHPEAVAHRRGRTERWVRERIALSALPAVARAAWFADEIGLNQARALTLGDAAAIEALFADPQAKAILSDAGAIRRALRPDAMASTAPLAVFVGLDAYVAAGGATRSDLFEDRTLLLDVGLLNSLATRKLAAEADRLCKEEGWGQQLFDPAETVGKHVGFDFTPAERDELHALEEQIGASPAAHPESEARVAEIYRLGVLRKVSKSDRARHGVYVGIDSDGRLDVTRGLVVGGAATHSAATQPADAAVSGARSETAETIARPRPAATALAAPPVLHADARRLADMAASRAAATAIGFMLPGDAVRIALVAMLAKGEPPVAISRKQGPGGGARDLVRRLARLDFAAALQLAGDSSDEDVEDAFSVVVGASVDVRGADEAATRGLIGFIERADTDGFDSGFAKLFDYSAFFAAAGRAAALDAIRDCGGEAEASRRVGMRDDHLAEDAARMARAKCWAPEYLRGGK